ncbi:MAG: molybdenum cofactor guanylyltransferase [Opitutaceae bacterium]|nr:molybdenum cofactor guanylyltransferase [Opitutaceae bacterium]
MTQSAEASPVPPAPVARPSAVLLAAGRSIRMGSDKALLEVNGIALWRRQRDVLAAAGASEIFLSARPDQPWAETADGFNAVVRDVVPGFGPIAGITAALERAAHSHLLVLAIDLPRMPAAWFGRLLRDCSAGMGAVGRREGMFEPLAAVYPRELLPVCHAAIARGHRSLQALLAAAVAENRMREHEITAAETPWFENWNERGFPAPKSKS